MPWVSQETWRRAHYVRCGGQFTLCGHVGKKAVRGASEAPEGMERCLICADNLAAICGERGDREEEQRFLASGRHAAVR